MAVKNFNRRHPLARSPNGYQRSELERGRQRQHHGCPDGAPEGMAPSGVNNVLRAHQGALEAVLQLDEPQDHGRLRYGLHVELRGGAGRPGRRHDAPRAVPRGQRQRAPRSTSTIWARRRCSTTRRAPGARCRRRCGMPTGFSGWPTTRRRAPIASSTAQTRRAMGADWSVYCQGGHYLGSGPGGSRTGYAGLFAGYGTTYGVGDGSTTFNLPDLQGRVVAGAGGSYVLGAAIGSDTNTASVTVERRHVRKLGCQHDKHGYGRGQRRTERFRREAAPALTPPTSVTPTRT